MKISNKRYLNFYLVNNKVRTIENKIKILMFGFKPYLSSYSPIKKMENKET